ncbi:MAG: OmpA family protein [Proteobacteria bacterium]|nr:OmpA family protein [Pseudomonadota bacterium]
MNVVTKVSLILGLLVLVSGCQSTSFERQLSYNKSKMVELEQERDKLEFQLATCEGGQSAATNELVSLQERFANVSAKNAALESEISALMSRPEPASAIIEELQIPDLESFEGIEGLTATSDESGIRLTIDQSVLFSSGSADVTRKGQETLKKMASILKREYSGRIVRVEGHTDSTPIVKTKSRWGSNWALSSFRACAVLRKLLSEEAMKPANVSAVGFGEQRPIADNKTKAGRRLNRRVEVIVEN